MVFRDGGGRASEWVVVWFLFLAADSGGSQCATMGCLKLIAIMARVGRITSAATFVAEIDEGPAPGRDLKSGAKFFLPLDGPITINPRRTLLDPGKCNGYYYKVPKKEV